MMHITICIILINKASHVSQPKVTFVEIFVAKPISLMIGMALIGVTCPNLILTHTI
jgi:hypothetical protein